MNINVASCARLEPGRASSETIAGHPESSRAHDLGSILTEHRVCMPGLLTSLLLQKFVTHASNPFSLVHALVVDAAAAVCFHLPLGASCSSSQENTSSPLHLHLSVLHLLLRIVTRPIRRFLDSCPPAKSSPQHKKGISLHRNSLILFRGNNIKSHVERYVQLSH